MRPGRTVDLGCDVCAGGDPRRGPGLGGAAPAGLAAELVHGSRVPHPASHNRWFSAQTARWAIADRAAKLDPDESFEAHVFVLDGHAASLHLLHGYSYAGQILNHLPAPPAKGLRTEVYTLANIIESRRPLHDILLEGMALLQPVRWSLS